MVGKPPCVEEKCDHYTLDSNSKMCKSTREKIIDNECEGKPIYNCPTLITLEEAGRRSNAGHPFS